MGTALVGLAIGNGPEMGGGPGSGLLIEAVAGGPMGRCGAGSFAPGTGRN